VAYKGKRRGTQRVLYRKHGIETPLQGLGIDVRIILKLILNTSVGRTRTALTWFRIGIGGDLL
jgi:hypothetical protein